MVATIVLIEIWTQLAVFSVPLKDSPRMKNHTFIRCFVDPFLTIWHATGNRFEERGVVWLGR